MEKREGYGWQNGKALYNRPISCRCMGAINFGVIKQGRQTGISRGFFRLYELDVDRTTSD